MSRCGLSGCACVARPVAANFAKAGHQVLGFHAAAKARERMSIFDQNVSSAREAAERADTLATMLPNVSDVHDVVATRAHAVGGPSHHRNGLAPLSIGAQHAVS